MVFGDDSWEIPENTWPDGPLFSGPPCGRSLRGSMREFESRNIGRSSPYSVVGFDSFMDRTDRFFLYGIW